MKKQVGLIGGPAIKHYSIADIVWRKISHYAKMPFEYEMWAVGSRHGLDARVRSLMGTDGFLGCNIALPWKSEIVRYSTYQDRFVSATGLANSLVKRDNGSFAFNTDPSGCHEGMMRYGFHRQGETVFILGAGGAGTALAMHLAQEGHSIIVTDIVPWKVERTESLARTLNLDVRSIRTEEVHRYIRDADVIVNATDVGKVKDRRRNVFPKESPIHSDLLRSSRAYMVVEMNYLPLKTYLLQQAEELHKVVVPGVEMLVRQAVRTFNVAFETQLGATLTDRIVSEMRSMLMPRRLFNSRKRSLRRLWADLSREPLASEEVDSIRKWDIIVL